MSSPDENTPADASEDDASTLAAAIAAHLELKKDHGADPDAVEQELRSALGAPVRDQLAAVSPPAPVESPPVSAPDVDTDSLPEDASDEAPSTEPGVPGPGSLAAELEPELPVEPESDFEEFSAPEPEPVPPAAQPAATAQTAATAQPAATAEPAAPPAETSDTGTFEFNWSRDDAPAEPDDAANAAKAERDVLEDTPDFFEETPEYDRLWFEEKSPKDFDF
ncbi:MAG: hypothetical protein WAP35_00710 [Solirubrobacterales bacterium]